jgi:hypothetical protein
LRRLVLLALAGCSGGATSDLGYGNELVVPGAQFRPGEFPEATGGPPVVNFTSTHTGIVIGQIRETITAVLDGSATGAILGIAGTPGAWIATTQPPDVTAPGEATLALAIGLAADAQAGPFTLLLAGVDEAGRISEPASLDYVAVATPPPSGDLVIALVWDSTADLDLHVVDPLGGEAYSAKPSTFTPPPPGMPIDPATQENEVLASGWLDHDANAGCTTSGAPSEHVIWTPRVNPNTGATVQPVIPSGTYTVRVDTRSLCEDAQAYWYVEADSESVDVGNARGVSTSEDVLARHGNGAGVTALTFEIP